MSNLVTFLESAPRTISAETTLHATPEQVYALVANPANHAELDGGGTVRSLRSGQDGLVSVGDKFWQNMVLGIPYTLPMTVTRAETNRAVTWRHPAGHTWGWEINDHHDGTVTVRETFDASEAGVLGLSPAPLYAVLGSFAANRKNIALTLANLHRIFD